MMGSEIAAFYREVAKNKIIRLIQIGEDNCLNWTCEDGCVTIPICSSESRVKRILNYLPDVTNAKPVSISLQEFYYIWVPDLKQKRIALGPNWAGNNITGANFSTETIVSGIISTQNKLVEVNL